MNKDRICILLTGTIAPSNVPDLLRTDPTDRENDYFYAIEQWMQLNYPVVFVENSNYPSERIAALFTGRSDCEYIKFDTQVSSLGKSHGESEIIEYAFNNSKIIGETLVVAKSSGRQYVRNAMPIINFFVREQLYVIGWFKYGLKFADSRFFVANKSFYLDYLKPSSKKINEKEGVFFEHVLASSVLRAMADGKKWSLPNVAPICEGISGTGNIVYKNGFLKVIKGNIIVKITNWLLNLEY
ncbi:hypothetical protein [Spirosoma pomorum]